MHDDAKSRITVEELFSVLKSTVFHRLLIPKITHPKSTSAKPAMSTANVDVANDTASRTHKCFHSSSLIVCLPGAFTAFTGNVSRPIAKDKRLGHLECPSSGAYSVQATIQFGEMTP